MAKVLEDGNNLILKLSTWEKIGALHNDLVVPKDKLVKKLCMKILGAGRYSKAFAHPVRHFPL